MAYGIQNKLVLVSIKNKMLKGLSSELAKLMSVTFTRMLSSNKYTK